MLPVLEIAARKLFNNQIENNVNKVLPDYGPTAYLKLSFTLFRNKTCFDADNSYIVEMTDTSLLQVPSTLKIIPETTNLGTPYVQRHHFPMKAIIKYKIIDGKIIKETPSDDSIIKLLAMN
ncbi:hypothetical protein QTN25_002458 [Entamoeba marina]